MAGRCQDARDGSGGGKSRVKMLDIDGEPGDLQTLIAARVAALEAADFPA